MLYPQTWISMHCGRICCDGCRHRPALAAHHEQRGELDKYEARQSGSRELVAKWEAERLAELESAHG